MDPPVDVALKEVLRNTLDNLAEADFKRFKRYLRDQGQIAWKNLEFADTDDTVDLMVQVYSSGAGYIMLSILQTMKQNNLAKYLEKELLRLGVQQDCPGEGEGVNIITVDSKMVVNDPARGGGGVAAPQQGGGQAFFRRHKAALERRLGLLGPVLSELEACEVLNDQEREDVESKESGTKQNRALLLMLEHKGGPAQEEFYRVLLRKNKFLVQDLEQNSACGTSA